MPEKRVTLKDIAQKVGVSRMAVSHVLLGTAKGKISVGKEKTALIREAAEAMGYVPNRAAQVMHGAKSRLVGVLYDSTHLGFGLTRLNDTFNHIARNSGYSVVSAITDYKQSRQEEAVRNFRSLQMDGIFCMAQDPSTGWEGYGQLLDPFEHVAVLGPAPSARCLADAYPFHQLSRLAVDHLVESGRRRLALALMDQWYLSSIQRKEAFLARIDYCGPEVSGVVLDAGAKPGEGLMETAARVLSEIQAAGANGVIAHNDQAASALMSVARQAGVNVPGQLGIVGLDNEPFCQTLIPSLTTIDMNWNKIAGRLFSRLIATIEGKDDDDEVAAPILRPRDSTVS